MDKNGGSRLLQMQARFQQKQLQERELKIASLYEAQQARALDRVRHSPSNGVTASSPPQPPPASHQPGKVRQMFEERRTKAGIDKSYPLQPIHNTERPARKPLPNGYTKVSSTATSRVSVEKKTTKHTISSHTVKKQQHKIENIVNGSGDLNHNHEPDLNSMKPALPRSNGELITSIDEVDNYLIENETFPDALAPIPTPRSPEPQPEPKKPQRRSPAIPSKGSPVKSKPHTATFTPPRKTNSDNAVTENSKARGPMQRGANPVTTGRSKKNPQSSSSSKPRAPSGSSTAAGASSAGSGAECTVCGRRFAPDRLAKHQEICKKAHTKKRKPFDVLKHRLAGTEAEPFINKLRKSQVNPPTTKVNKTQNSNWRQKHEEFIQAIRAAKQVQAHLNAGGKLSAPPPPPSENPDYVQCPHCSRRFNQAAAERHIPKCANYQFNKPKPAAKRR
ncbi:LOW QUALITY PROTEIN: uncharacterized protein ACR2FA_007876 [Aphomia sociella]